MVSKINVEGYEELQKAIEANKGKTIFLEFSGSLGSDGKSWCPDCVTAEPVIQASLEHAPKDAIFIHCGVGDRAFWKDQSNVFRTDPNLCLKSVPTLMRLGKPQRLEEGQCAQADLVKMLLEDD